jgi:hypothetical protein
VSFICNIFRTVFERMHMTVLTMNVVLFYLVYHRSAAIPRRYGCRRRHRHHARTRTHTLTHLFVFYFTILLSFTGALPSLVTTAAAGATAIGAVDVVPYLQAKVKDIDLVLSPPERAVALALRAMVADRLMPAFHFMQWDSHAAYARRYMHGSVRFRVFGL